MLRHLGSFQCFATLNNATMNNLGYLYFYVVGGIYLGQILRSGISGWKDKCIWCFVRDHWASLPGDGTISYFYKQWTQVPASLASPITK